MFPDGVYFVGLAGIDADTVDNTIAEGLQVRREPRRSSLESVIGWLRDRQVLLVLDNCEQVIAAAHVAVERLSETMSRPPRAGHSRLPLGVPGELRMPLPPLDESSALELFVDRLVVTTPTFEVERRPRLARTAVPPPRRVPPRVGTRRGALPNTDSRPTSTALGAPTSVAQRRGRLVRGTSP